jgi:hypothetical protein
LEGVLAKDSRYSPRIRTLLQQILKLALQRKFLVKLFPRKQVMNIFVLDGEWTRHALAETIVPRHPQQLTAELSPKRQAWMSEDAKIDIFVAVVQGLIFFDKSRLLE